MKSGAAGRRLRIALVYPPFGPAGLPSLGLGLLSAGLKQKQFECWTYYWNLDLIPALPGNDLAARVRTYWSLTGRAWQPFAEWAFTSLVFDGRLDHQQSRTEQELQQRASLLQNDAASMDHILWLRSQSAALVDAAAEKLADFDVIGISTTFFQNIPALALALRLKQRWPEKLIVFGGANCDGEMGKALFSHFPFLDFLFSGEADWAFPAFVEQLARGRSLHDIPGLFGRSSDGAMFNGPPSFPIADLDSLPLPDFDDYMRQRAASGIHDLQRATLPLESSRGCWWGQKHHCTFCGLNANGIAYRRKSAERFRLEVETITRKYQVNFVFMADNILPSSYHEGLPTPTNGDVPPPHFFFEVKSNMKRGQLARLAQTGLSAVQPGIESFSTSILRLMRKGVSGIQNVAFLKYCREYGITCTYNFLLGFPGEDPDEHLRLIEQLPRLFHLRPPTAIIPIEFHRFSPYHQGPQDFGLKLLPGSSYRHLYPFPDEAIAHLAYLFDADPPVACEWVVQRLYPTVQAWHEAYREDVCSLTWQARGDDIVITDSRPRYGLRQVRLKRYAAELFRRIDEPRSVAWLVRDALESRSSESWRPLLDLIFSQHESQDAASICFEAQEFASDPEGCLQEFERYGLIFSDTEAAAPAAGHSGKYVVALPVHASYRATEQGWRELGI